MCCCLCNSCHLNLFVWKIYSHIFYCIFAPLENTEKVNDHVLPQEVTFWSSILVLWLSMLYAALIFHIFFCLCFLFITRLNNANWASIASFTNALNNYIKYSVKDFTLFKIVYLQIHYKLCILPDKRFVLIRTPAISHQFSLCCNDRQLVPSIS